VAKAHPAQGVHMVYDLFGAGHAEVEYAIEDALDHARALGDYRTAGELELILDGMQQQPAHARRRLVH
jgi:hypothetical protein